MLNVRPSGCQPRRQAVAFAWESQVAGSPAGFSRGGPGSVWGHPASPRVGRGRGSLRSPADHLRFQYLVKNTVHQVLYKFVNGLPYRALISNSLISNSASAQALERSSARALKLAPKKTPEPTPNKSPELTPKETPELTHKKTPKLTPPKKPERIVSNSAHFYFGALPPNWK